MRPIHHEGGGLQERSGKVRSRREEDINDPCGTPGTPLLLSSSVVFFLATFLIWCLHLAIFLFAARHSNCLCVSVIFTESTETVRSNFASLVGNFGESGADPRVPAHCDYVWRRVHSHERRARAHLNPELMADASSLCLSTLHHCMIMQTRCEVLHVPWLSP